MRSAEGPSEDLDERIDLVARAISATAHALAGPLQSATNALFIVTQRLERSTAGAESSLIEAQAQLQLACQRLEALMQLPESRGVANRTEILLGQLIELALAQSEPGRERVNVELQQRDARCAVDPSLFPAAIAALLRNAVEQGAAGHPVLLHAGVAGRSLRVRIINRARAAWPWPPHRAIDPLYTTKPHSLGLGLPMARAVASAHGGGLSIAEDAGRTIVELTVPLRAETTTNEEPDP